MREARKSLDGPGASSGAVCAQSEGVGSIFVVMAGLVKSGFSTTGGGSQARPRAHPRSTNFQDHVRLASQAAAGACITVQVLAHASL